MVIVCIEVSEKKVGETEWGHLNQGQTPDPSRIPGRTHPGEREGGREEDLVPSAPVCVHRTRKSVNLLSRFV